MIKPILSNSFAQPNFKGHFDPTCISVPTSMKEQAGVAIDSFIKDSAPALESMVRDSGETVVGGIISKFQNALPDASNTVILDGANLLNTESQTLTHLLPDGTPVSIPVESGLALSCVQ